MSRTTADDRLRRILAVVPWVAARGGADVDEVCARFGCTEAQLQDDLELLFMCGVAPFTPDSLVEAWVDGGRVHISYADWLRRPLRLTPAQALVLVATGQALLAVPGAEPSGPLASALEKVAAAAGVEPGEGVDVELGAADVGVLADLQAAVAAAEQVELDYYSFSSDRLLARRVDPWLAFSSGGAWYLRGHDHLAGEPRLFRVDRVRGVRRTGQRFDPPADPGPATPYQRRPDDPIVVVELAPEAAWVAGAHPHEGVEELPGGRLRVRLPASTPGWLARLLVRLGPAATVVEDPAGAAEAAREAARRVLARYR